MVGESGKGQQGSNTNQTRLDKKSRNTSGREWPERENQEGTRRRWKGSKGSRKTKKSRNKVTQGWGVVDRGIVMKEGQVYILEEELREEVIYLHHDTLVGEHGRR